MLSDYRFAFLGTPEDPTGIVTRYDLNKLPVYHWLYGEFSRFEIGLRDLLRTDGVDISNQDVTTVTAGGGDLVPDSFAKVKLSELVAMMRDAGLVRRVRQGRNCAATLDDLVKLRNTVARYNTLVHMMSDRQTLDDPERGAQQLNEEVRLLLTVVENLEYASKNI